MEFTVVPLGKEIEALLIEEGHNPLFAPGFIDLGLEKQCLGLLNKLF